MEVLQSVYCDRLCYDTKGNDSTAYNGDSKDQDPWGWAACALAPLSNGMLPNVYSVACHSVTSMHAHATLG